MIRSFTRGVLTGTLLLAAGCGSSQSQQAATQPVAPPPPAPAPAPVAEPMAPAQPDAQAIGAEAYVYGYPLVLMDVTRRVLTNTDKATPDRAPINTLTHRDTFPDDKFRAVVRPNVDTFYSMAWMDLSQEPMVLSMPEAGDRYYVMQLMDAWTNVFAAPGPRTTGTKAGSFAITGPGWQGQLPEGVQRIQAPTNIVWLIGRVAVNGKADTWKVKAFQKKMALEPLSNFGKPEKEKAKTVAQKAADGLDAEPMAYVKQMSPTDYFQYLSALLLKNPPPAADAPIIGKMRSIGLVPGAQVASVPEAYQAGLLASVPAAQQHIAATATATGQVVNGWRVSLDNIGTYGTNYDARAAIALAGLGANLPQDAVYPLATTDSTGQPLDNGKHYVMRFAKDQTPPVKAFWSLTLYDAEGYLAKNKGGIYEIASRDKLKAGDDGSIAIAIQRDKPKDPKTNWLPAPEADGTFTLVLRMYWPDQPVLNGTWKVPPVTLVEEKPPEE